MRLVKNNLIKITCLFISLLCLLTGCSNEDIKMNPYSFNLNFRYFLLPDTQSAHAIKISSIDLENDNVTLEDLASIDGIIYTIYQNCADKDFYMNNFNKDDIFYEKIKDSCDIDFFDSIKESNDFKKSIDNIYSKENMSLYDTEIISLNYKNKERYYEVELICVNDTNLFQIEYVNFYVNEENKITKIELVDDLQGYENTTKPLNNDSLLNKEGIHNDFINSFNEFKNQLYNGALYNKYHLAISNEILMTDEEHELTQEEIDSQEYLDLMELQLTTLIENINSNLDLETLKKFFISGEGVYTNTFVTGYQINDFNGLALSYYNVQSVSNGVLTTFEFTFDRIENKIIDIKII